jgi:hypothetical protein
VLFYPEDGGIRFLLNVDIINQIERRHNPGDHVRFGLHLTRQLPVYFLRVPLQVAPAMRIPNLIWVYNSVAGDSSIRNLFTRIGSECVVPSGVLCGTQGILHLTAANG